MADTPNAHPDTRLDAALTAVDERPGRQLDQVAVGKELVEKRADRFQGIRSAHVEDDKAERFVWSHLISPPKDKTNTNY